MLSPDNILAGAMFYSSTAWFFLTQLRAVHKAQPPFKHPAYPTEVTLISWLNMSDVSLSLKKWFLSLKKKKEQHWKGFGREESLRRKLRIKRRLLEKKKNEKTQWPVVFY